MIKKVNNTLCSIYVGSGYLAAIFLIAVLFFILIGISSRIFGFYIRGLAEYSGYSMAASSFFALSYTFYERAHIRITLFLEKLKPLSKKITEIWCLFIASIFSAFLAFYFIKMTVVSIKFEERSEGADEILIWIPQTAVALGSFIFFICIVHHLIYSILGKKIK
jgi:TRAP-type C4-dicarboxylate transport system permease small subunit